MDRLAYAALVNAGASPTGRFLDVLTDDDARELRAVGRTRDYDAGDVIFHQGDEAGGVAILLSGRVKITNIAAGGKEVILAFRGPGDIVGEISAIAHATRSSAVRAIEPVQTLAVGASEFRAFLDSHAHAAMNLVLMLIERLREADQARVEFAGHDVIGRVARRLVELCERFGEPCDEGIEVTLALSQEELAGWTSSSREAVAKAMRLLRELGWIHTHRRRIVVCELEALRRYAA
jgi:CRP/FNR family cyclic AMP-dependent transcriptional regulator